MLWVNGLSLSGATINLRLKVYNPNRYSLDVKGLTYNVTKTSDGTAIASATFPKGFVVPASKSTTTTASVKISYAGIGAAGKSLLRRGKVSYKVVGTLSVGTGGKKTVLKIPYSCQGEFNLLDKVPVDADLSGIEISTQSGGTLKH